MWQSRSRKPLRSGNCCPKRLQGLCSGPYASCLTTGVCEQRSEKPMDRRTFFTGVLGGLVVAPTIIAAASSVEAAPLPDALPPPPEPLPGATSASTLTEADLGTVKADWTQAARRTARRTARRVTRRRY